MTEKFDFTEGAQFDPGFIGHLNAFVPSIEYIYQKLYRFKNFNQKNHSAGVPSVRETLLNISCTPASRAIK